MADRVLELKDLCARRGRFSLHAVSATVDAGETLGVLGPSGCGKSTLLETIAGLTAPTSGQRTLNGHVAMAMQEPGLWDRLSARRNVALACTGDTPDEWLDRVGFSADRDMPTAGLSGGERQRVGLARALSRKAALTLLDEPGSGLDRLSNLRLAETTSRLVRERNGALVVVAHRLDEILRYEPRRLLVLEAGRVARYGDAADVIRDPQTFYVASLLGYEIMTPARTGDDRQLQPATAEGSSVAPSSTLHAWRFGGIRESSTGDIPATVIALLTTEFGDAARVESGRGDNFLIPATDRTLPGAQIMLVHDQPVVLRA